MREKKPYTKPRIAAAEKIEARAINCMANPRRPGKGSPASCAKIRS